MFIYVHRKRLAFLQPLPPGVQAAGKSLAVDSKPLDVDIFRRSFSVEESVGSQMKLMRLVVYCKLTRDVAKAGGKLAPKIMVFVAGAQKADAFAFALNEGGIKSLSLTENRLLKNHRVFTKKFVNGDVDVLVCTDDGAFDLQIPDVDHVVHLDLPSKEDFAQFGIRSGYRRRPDVATGDQLGGHVHVLFDKERDENVVNDLLGYINKHQVGPVPLSSIY